MKVAITGASGHIGSNLCRALLEKSYSVNALKHNDICGLEGIDINLVSGDILDPDSLRSLIKDAEIVFHLAASISVGWRNRNQLEKINIEGTKNVTRISMEAGVRRLIHFSSIHALQQEPKDQMLDEKRPLAGENDFLYDRTKAESERIILDAVSKGLDAVIINPTAVIGPHDYKPSLLGQALMRIYRGSLPGYVPGGYDWVDVRDVVDGAISAINKGRKGERYLLSGKWESIKTLGSIIGGITNKKPAKFIFPFWLAKAGLPFLQLYGKLNNTHPLYTHESLEILKKGNKNINSSKAKSELDFSTRDLSQTIKDTIMWFKEYGYID